MKNLARTYATKLKHVTDWLAAARDTDVLFLAFDDVVTRPESAVRQLEEFLPEALDAAAVGTMFSAVDPALRRQRVESTVPTDSAGPAAPR